MNLEEIYNNPEFGFKSTDKFYKYIRMTYPDSDVKMKTINDCLKTKRETQLFKNVPDKGLYNHIVNTFVGESVQIYICDFNMYKSSNNNFRFWY